MSTNTATLQLKIKVSDDGTVKVLESVGKAANKAGDEGKRGFDKMGASAKKAGEGYAMLFSSLKQLAAAYVGVQTAKAVFEKGFAAVDTYQKSIASLAAMVTTFGERQKGMGLEDQWKDALKYATAMVPVLENIAAKTLLSGEETTALANAFARSGVFLESTNQAQMESFTRISNALPLLTDGQEIMRQINTEIRAVMTGSNESTSMLLTTLKAIDPQIEKNLKTWRTSDTVLENIGGLLSGFGPATALLENQWQAVKSTIDTTATQVLRGLMQPAYRSIIDKTKEMNGWLIENKEEIADWGTQMHMVAIRVSQEFRVIAMGLDKIGGSLTQMQMLLYGPGMMLGAESSTKRFDAALARNQEYEKRFKESDAEAAALEKRYQALEFSLTAEGKAQAKAAKEAGDAIAKIKGVATATGELTKEQESAAKAAAKHSDAIRQTIDNLNFELSILGKSEAEQAALNAVRSAGAGATDAQKKAIYGLTMQLDMEKKAIAERNAEWAKYDGFMSNDDQAAAVTQHHEGMMDVQAANLKSMEEYNEEYSKNTSDTAKEVEDTWKHTAEKIQDAFASLFSETMKGNSKSFGEFFESIGNTMIDVSSQKFAENFPKLIADMKLGEALGGPLGKVFKDLTDGVNFEISNLVAVAATLYNTTKMTKTQGAISGGAAGAQAGATKGWQAAVVGGILGAAAGSMLGDNGPSYGEQLADSIDNLIETLKTNTRAIADQILKTDELTLAQESMIRDIFSTKMEGVNATLAGAFKIPEGMRKRSDSSDIYQAVALDFVSSFVDTIAGEDKLNIMSRTVLKDKGYTSYDYSKSETSGIISSLVDEIGVPDFISLMAETSNDAGALIQALIKSGDIAAEIPQRVLDHYSEGTSSKSKRIEKVAEAIFETMLNGIMELSKGIDAMNMASDAFAKTWKDKDLTAYDKDKQDWDETMNVFAGEGMQNYLAQIKATRDALMNMPDEKLDKMDAAALADHFKNIDALNKVLTDSTGKLAEAEQTRILIEKHYADLRAETTASMAYEMDVAAGNLTELDQAYKGIMDKAESYRVELIDQGMTYAEAEQAAYDWAVAMKAAVRESRSAAILENAGDVVSTSGMTDLESTLYGINKAYQANYETLKEIDPAMVADGSTFMQAWGIEIENAKESAYSTIIDFYDTLKEQVSDLIWDLQGGSLAPVQSMEAMNARYQNLYQGAMTSGDSNKFTSFVSGEFVDFLKGYGNYADVNSKIVTDLTALEAKIDYDAGASIGDLSSQLTTSNTSLAQIYQEMVNLNSTMSQITAADGYAGGNVTVRVYVGDKELKDITVQTLRTNPEAQAQVRRIAAAG